MKKIHLGSDHAGFFLKTIIIKELEKLGYSVEDHGTNSEDSCDYPLIAREVCQKIAQDQSIGILICGTGIGMSIAANRYRNIRAALCSNELQARMARRHNDANILCLGARVTGSELALAIMAAFLESSFDGGRHQRRLEQLNS